MQIDKFVSESESWGICEIVWFVNTETFKSGRLWNVTVNCYEVLEKFTSKVHFKTQKFTDLIHGKIVEGTASTQDKDEDD